MSTILNEYETRVIPIDRVECSYARNRDPAERPPIPKPGDKLFYRHREWDRELISIEVLEVQSLDELWDKNIGYVVRDNFTGKPIVDAGMPRMVRVQDPWPWVQFLASGVGMVRTWEARVRGSAGWLPLNWHERPLRLPWDVVVRPLPDVNW